MRRAVAISLMMLFSWTLIAPLVAAGCGGESSYLLLRKGKVPLHVLQA